MRGRHHPGLPGRAPIPDRKDSNASPTFVHPHPRHGGRSVRANRANHPTYLHHELHLVDYDHSPADNHHNGTPHDDDRSRTRGANVSPTAGSPARDGYAMPTGDRGTDREALVPVRTGGRAVGDRDRLARVELPARRGEPHWLLLDLPDGTAIARTHVRSRRVSRLVLGAFQCGSEHPGRRIALCGLGILTLATLIAEVL